MSVPLEIPSDIIEKIPASSTLTQSSENIASRPTEEFIHEIKHALDDYPDGGLRAWLIVAGSMCNNFTTFGYVNSWGVFQSYYQTNVLKDIPPSDIAWIGSIQYSLVFLPGLLAGRLFDLGYFRRLFAACSVLLVVATLLVAECHEYWQLLLCQGFAVGLACGGIVNPTTAVLSHWFKKRLRFSLGLMAVGSSLGGTVIPITARNLLPLVGFKWTMRIIALILLLGLGLSNLLIKRRFPPTDVRGGLFNFHEFKSASFSLYCASTLTSFLGIYTVLIYIDVSATKVGVPEDFSFYLVSIANCSSGFGRYFAGLLGDRIGAMNVMIPFTAASAVVTYSWPFARDQSSLITVAVIYGFTSGSFVSLLCAPIIEFGDTADVGRRVGMMMSILAVGALVGPPISGSINAATGGFEAVGYYAGSTVIASVGLMSASRHFVLRRLYGKL
ncbi:major facilitator superfamily domain-containing protein [Armillaria novae-zelandiae]|uniref:Major facilitator superfamily domain-containing protein n=1 Tax=Armillaria novae-zelandiae TaxID=153914 RepID=A0AA39NYI4_9AGAR|nr:major facilitator superfamily domain-containing protein [Armillaria novae-zelandiae]